MGQEHRQLAGDCATVERSMRASGWRLGMTPAVYTGDSAEAESAAAQPEGRQRVKASAGTMVAAPMHVGCEPLKPGCTWDWSPVGCAGRLAAGWVNMLGGVVAISAAGTRGIAGGARAWHLQE